MCSVVFAFLGSVNDLGIVHRDTIKLITAAQNVQLGLQFLIGEKFHLYYYNKGYLWFFF